MEMQCTARPLAINTLISPHLRKNVASVQQARLENK